MKNDDETTFDSHELSVKYFRQMMSKINCDTVTRMQILLNVYGTGTNPNNLRYLKETAYRWLLRCSVKGDIVIIAECLDQIRRFEQAIGHEVIPKGLSDMDFDKE